MAAVILAGRSSRRTSGARDLVGLVAGGDAADALSGAPVERSGGDGPGQALVDSGFGVPGTEGLHYNNAGFGGVSGPIAEIPVDGYDNTMGVLLRGVFLGMKHAAPIMKRQGSGSIVSTASVAGLQAGYGPLHIYSAAKAAVVHLTRSVAMELGESGVRVNCICPGGIATPIFGEAVGVSGAEADRVAETMKTLLAARQPIQRAGLPEDIARAALWLASDDSSFVNGHALIVDGGLIGGRMWSVVREQRQQLRAALGIGA